MLPSLKPFGTYMIEMTTTEQTTAVRFGTRNGIEVPEHHNRIFGGKYLNFKPKITKNCQ